MAQSKSNCARIQKKAAGGEGGIAGLHDCVIAGGGSGGAGIYGRRRSKGWGCIRKMGCRLAWGGSKGVQNGRGGTRPSRKRRGEGSGGAPGGRALPEGRGEEAACPVVAPFRENGGLGRREKTRYGGGDDGWRDGGVAERAGLENRISRKRDGGSNPSLSENLGREPRGGQKAEKNSSTRC